MLILEDNRQSWFALPPRRDGLFGPVCANLLSLPHAHIARHTHAVHPHIPVFQGLLHCPLRHIGQLQKQTGKHHSILIGRHSELHVDSPLWFIAA